MPTEVFAVGKYSNIKRKMTYIFFFYSIKYNWKKNPHFLQHFKNVTVLKLV